MSYTQKELRLCGVYAIVHRQSGKRYVGSTARSFRERWKEHRIDLRKNKARNARLQRAWNKYGEPSFDFVILEICCGDMSVEREQFYIDMLHPEYNLAPQAGSNKGIKNPAMSARLRAQWQQTAYRSKMTTVSRNQTPDRERLSALAKLRWQRPGFRERISRANTGHIASEEARAAMRRAWETRKPLSLEARLRRSRGQTGRKHSDESKDKRALTRTGGRTVSFVAPDGTVYRDIANVSAFAAEHGLHKRLLAALAAGQRKQVSGWTLL